MKCTKFQQTYTNSQKQCPSCRFIPTSNNDFVKIEYGFGDGGLYEVEDVIVEDSIFNNTPRTKRVIKNPVKRVCLLGCPRCKTIMFESYEEQ